MCPDPLPAVRPRRPQAEVHPQRALAEVRPRGDQVRDPDHDCPDPHQDTQGGPRPRPKVPQENAAFKT